MKNMRPTDNFVIIMVAGTSDLSDAQIMGAYSTISEAKKWIHKIANKYGPDCKKSISEECGVLFEDGTLFRIESEYFA